jgi:ligand-binding sensor domain-containing protein/signal transduction histidine kinase
VGCVRNADETDGRKGARIHDAGTLGIWCPFSLAASSQNVNAFRGASAVKPEHCRHGSHVGHRLGLFPPESELASTGHAPTLVPILGMRGVLSSCLRSSVPWLRPGIWILLAMLIRWAGQAQVSPGRIEWRQWKTEQGLPDNAIECVHQARDGWIWVGTRRGVARFDGVEFTRFNSQEHGFTDDACTTLAEDDAGRLCVGTKRGLYRLSVRGFERLRIGDESEHPHIRSLFPGAKGGLWVVTADRLSLWRNGKWRHVEFRPGSLAGWEGRAAPQVFGADEDADGRLWVASDAGLWRLDAPGQAWHELWHRPIPPAGSSDEAHIVRAVRAMGGDEAWFATDFALLHRRVGGGCEALEIPPGVGDARVRRLLVGGEGIRVVAGGRIHRVGPGGLQSTSFREEQDDAFVTDLLEDRDGTTWLAARYGGLIQVCQRRVNMFTTRDGLPHNNVLSVSAASHGGVWVATGAGVAEFRSNRFEQITVPGFKPSHPWQTVLEDHAGDLWLGGYPSGIVWLTAPTNNPTEALSPGSRHVNACLRGLDGEPSAFSVRQNSARCFLEDRKGRLWVGCRSGLFIADAAEVPVRALSGGQAIGPVLRSRRSWRGYPGDGAFAESDWLTISLQGNRLPSRHYVRWDTAKDVPFPWRDEAPVFHSLPSSWHLPAAEVRVLLETRDGTMWLGTTDGLLRTGRGGSRNLRRAEGLAGDAVDALCEDSEGTLWVGSRHGLSRYREGHWRVLGPEEGVPETAVNQILEDADKAIWLGGRHGLTRIRREDIDRFDSGASARLSALNLGEVDGMLTAETMGGSQPSGARTPDGRLWFATSQGVATVDPSALRGEQPGPRAFVEMFQSQVGAFESALPADGSLSSPVVQLPKGSGRNLEIHYTALDYRAPGRLQFEYLLEGHDPRPVSAGGRRVAYFTNLLPGNYRFRVRAVNHDGMWSPSWAAAEFMIRPFFWETLWFRAVVGLVTAGLLAMAVIWRTREQRRYALIERENRVRMERERIARDLHDDVGANLTVITMLSGSDPDGLSRASSLADAALDNLGELVWATNPRFDSLDDLAAYLRELANRLLAGADLVVHFKFPDRLPSLPVSGDCRRQTVLLLKEAIHNVLKHAGCRNVTVELRVVQEILREREGTGVRGSFGAGLGAGLGLIRRWVPGLLNNVPAAPTWCLALVVWDDGAGMDNADLESLTDGNARRRGHESGGNGLNNLRSRVKAMGGTFEIHSQLGVGTRLEFVIPLAANGDPRVG